VNTPKEDDWSSGQTGRMLYSIKKIPMSDSFLLQRGYEGRSSPRPQRTQDCETSRRWMVLIIPLSFGVGMLGLGIVLHII
jgi:hypothetical protein